jgi:hypothetical protein
MKETLKGALIDFSKPASLDNLDFDTALIVRRAKEKGFDFEFGKYDRRDGSIEVMVERPDPPYVPAPGSQEEWEEKREWYLKNAGTDYKLFFKGLSEGYLIDWGPLFGDRFIWNDWGDFEDWSRLIEYWEEDECTWWKRLWNELEWKKRREEWKQEELAIRRQRYRERNPPKPKERRITKNGIKFIRQITKRSEINLDLPREALESPWETYEMLKEIYCEEGLSPKRYENRIEDIVTALAI